MPKKQQNKEELQGVGKIASVNREQKFVLIRIFRTAGARQAEIYFSQGTGRTASLKPTGETIGNYLAADITSGQVALGDPIFIRNPRSFLAEENQKVPTQTAREAKEAKKQESAGPTQNQPDQGVNDDGTEENDTELVPSPDTL